MFKPSYQKSHDMQQITCIAIWFKLSTPLISWKLGDVSTKGEKGKTPPAKVCKIHARLVHHATGEEIEKKVKPKRRESEG